MKKNKLISSALVIIIAVNIYQTTGLAKENLDTTIIIENVDVAISKDIQSEVVESETDLEQDMASVELIHNKGNINTVIDLEGEEVDIEVQLFPSQLEMFKESVVLGAVKEITDGYKLLSFRIEQDADSLTLMKPNYDMEGHTIINIGIKNIETDEIFYIQEEMDEFNYNSIYMWAENNYNRSDVEEEQVQGLETNYLALQDPDDEIETYEFFGEGVYDRNTGLVSQGSSRNNQQQIQFTDNSEWTIVRNIPDVVFKNFGPHNEWLIVSHDEGSGDDTIAIRTSKMPFSESSITYCIYITRPITLDWDDNLEQEMRIRDNVTVSWDAKRDRLAETARNQVIVKNPILRFTNTLPVGLFKKYRTYQDIADTTTMEDRLWAGMLGLATNGVSTVIDEVFELTGSYLDNNFGGHNLYEKTEDQIHQWGGVVRQVEIEGRSLKTQKDILQLTVFDKDVYQIKYEYGGSLKTGPSLWD